MNTAAGNNSPSSNKKWLVIGGVVAVAVVAILLLVLRSAGGSFENSRAIVTALNEAGVPCGDPEPPEPDDDPEYQEQEHFECENPDYDVFFYASEEAQVEGIESYENQRAEAQEFLDQATELAGENPDINLGFGVEDANWLILTDEQATAQGIQDELGGELLAPPTDE